MSFFEKILAEPFVWGLLLGLLVCGFVWKTEFTKRQHLKKDKKRIENELDELKGHLGTQLKINARGNETLTQQLDELKEQNENLRVNISSLQQKPDKAELKHLHITESAVRMMREQAPGFATAWEKALREAEVEYENAEGGLTKLVKKVIPQYNLASKKELTMKDEIEE